MNDGNMATTTISPVPTEDDMHKVRSIFEQGLNSILALAQISKDVEALKQELQSLRNDLDYVRQRNRELDQALSEVRSQRDTAMRERDEARHEAIGLRTELEEARRSVADLTDRLNASNNEHEVTRKDRDQAYDAWHKAEAAKDEAEQKLSDIQDYASRAFGLVKPQAPTVVNVPIEDSNKHAEPSPFIYEGEAGFNWNRPYEWDNSARKYRQAAA